MVADHALLVTGAVGPVSGGERGADTSAGVSSPPIAVMHTG